MTYPVRKCTSCLFYESIQKCAVFEEIPDEIWEGKIDHTESIEGDNGVVYTPIVQE